MAALNPRQAQTIFAQLYDSLDTYALAVEAKRAAPPPLDKSSTYGEITWDSFAALMAGLGQRATGTFYDLGCGAGKALVAAALLGNFHTIIGLELMPGLASLAQAQVEKFLPTPDLRLINPLPKIQVHNVNITHHSWTDANVVFAHSTCFTEALLKHLTNQAYFLVPSAIIITVTTPLESPNLTLLQTLKLMLGWGQATVYLYERS